MNLIAFLTGVFIVFSLFVICIYLIFCFKRPSASRPSAEEASASKAEEKPERSVITVRKAGAVPAESARPKISDHWEGDGGAPVGQLPVEVTKKERPELYAEYMSVRTSAVRKYEIIEILYTEGYSLPFQPGLNEQYKKELLQQNAERRRKPIDLTPSKPKTTKQQ